jgi:hypothetical protein
VNPVDGESYRQVDIARTQEVSVHRMDVAIIRNRARRGHHGLRQNLPTEDATMRLPLTRTGENILSSSSAGGGEIECFKQSIQRVAHAL